MIRTGFYGGSFNPIHNGHIALARRFLEDMKLDEVWFVVSPQNPFKRESNDLLDNQQRLQIVQTAIADEPRFHATDYEFRLPTPSYTWRTLQHLAQDEPEREFTLLIGADNWASFNRWNHHEDILAHHRIAVYPRRHFPIAPATLPPNVTLLRTPLYDISSTNIRHRIRQGMSVADVLPKNILEMAVAAYRVND